MAISERLTSSAGFLHQLCPSFHDLSLSSDDIYLFQHSDGLGVSETNASRDMKIFKRVLRDPKLRQPFQVFLEQQFCAENLNFYVAVERFREMQFNNESKASERAAFARHIYERHFASNSTEPVNVDNSTSKRIRETMQSGKYPRNTFDLAQYQIFHLLKYDCWPRFLRAGGVQPEFSDEDLAEEDEWQHRLDIGEDLSKSHGQRTASEGDRQASTSLLTLCSDRKKFADKEKLRSLLWHGFDRFSRKLRREPVARSTGGSPLGPRLSHQMMHRTSSSRAIDESHRSCSSSDENDIITTTTHHTARGGPIGGSSSSAASGSNRRHQFATAGKQYSMPTEMTAVRSPYRHLSPTRTEPKHCRLMTGDTCTTEVVELNDPTISVRQWTQNIAASLGMDKRSIEAVDAETCSTIDPARQAIDALQSRSVRIVPVVMFAVEILPPNYQFRNPSSTPTKVIMVRARQSLSIGGVLRPLLSKYSVDISTVAVVFTGTLDMVRNSVSIGTIGQRSLTIMSQAQYNERVSAGKKEAMTAKDPAAASSIFSTVQNLQFHQHGDISYCELPNESERLKHAQKDHSISLIKFVRKASAAVTTKEETTRVIGHRNTGRRKSIGQGSSAGVYCGEDVSPEGQRGPIRKRLSFFKNKGKDTCYDRPSTSSAHGESPNLDAREKSASTSQRQQPPPPPSEAVAATPAEMPPSLSSVGKSTSAAPTTERTSNGDAPRTPAIFSSKVCSDGEDISSKERGWQAAAYV
ncbi:hypothetical protein Q1695_000169 [Nippostrongylus brasiliensis]|nr:hypothetical protein Q1695_000169 [Nippostrongylus brasiliensis]